jgi:hypothetical protein
MSIFTYFEILPNAIISSYALSRVRVAAMATANRKATAMVMHMGRANDGLLPERLGKKEERVYCTLT